jgi:curved DNA-binding protein
LKIKGKGSKGSKENLHGDLFVRIRILPHERFTIQGNDLYITHEIDLYTAILGGDTTIKTLSDKVKAKIAEGTQNDDTIRLKGKGMPIYEKANLFGDLYVKLKIVLPKQTG